MVEVLGVRFRAAGCMRALLLLTWCWSKRYGVDGWMRACIYDGSTDLARENVSRLRCGLCSSWIVLRRTGNLTRASWHTLLLLRRWHFCVWIIYCT